MNNIAQNSTTSENEIKINMTFEEALQIIQNTYDDFEDIKKNKDKKNQYTNVLALTQLNTAKYNLTIGNYKCCHKIHNETSNFSGMVYIDDTSDTKIVNVVIACRGSLSIFNPTGLWKDWICNNSIMLFMYRTKSDEFAEKYAYHILENICQNYKDKEIHVITLGHSKGGREAQIQMLKILNEFENTQKIKKVSCFTFNSAPICKFDEDISKHKNYCQNFIQTDSLGIFKDILNLFDKYKYGKECIYHNDKNIELLKLWFLIPIAVIVSYILTLLTGSLNMQPIYSFILSMASIIIGFSTIFIADKNAAKLFLFSNAISSTIISMLLITTIRLLSVYEIYDSNLELSMISVLTTSLVIFIINILIMIFTISYKLHSIKFFSRSNFILP